MKQRRTFCFPDGPHDCLILAIAASRYAEILRQDDPESVEFRQAEELLRRCLERIITGLMQHIEESEIDEDVPDLLRHVAYDRNRAAVDSVHEIRQKQYETAKEAGVVDIAKADARFEMKHGEASHTAE